MIEFPCDPSCPSDSETFFVVGVLLEASAKPKDFNATAFNSCLRCNFDVLKAKIKFRDLKSAGRSFDLNLSSHFVCRSHEWLQLEELGDSPVGGRLCVWSR